MNKTLRSVTALTALMCSSIAFATVYNGEYFWNEDPGIGYATQIGAIDVGTDNILTTQIDASGLSNGINLLGLRVFNGQWSPTVWKFVFVPNESLTLTNGICEYFWDNDPGIGLANQQAITPGSTGECAVALDANDLSGGVHLLGMRVFGNGLWSPTVYRFVFIPFQGLTLENVICEYYWDNDPGIGLANQLNLAVDGDGTYAFDLSTTNLTSGIHLLGMRTFGNGLWGTTVYRFVYIKPTERGIIDAVEYYWGEDPGLGNGTAVAITPASEVEIENLVIDFPTDDQESYSLTIRAHSDLGGWGPYYTKEFVPIRPEAITLSDDYVRFRRLTDTHLLEATLTPEDAWDSSIVWSTSDAAVVTINEGLLTPVGDGDAVVTVSVAGTEYTAECKVMVLDETVFPLGDSNGSYDVTITDAATTVAYTLGDEPDRFLTIPADVNLDEDISLGDVVGTVNIVLGLDPNDVTRAPQHVNADCALLFGEVALAANVPATVSVSLSNNIDLTALQMDLHLPEGVELIDAHLGNRSDATHALEYREIEPGVYRLVAYSLSNAMFTGNAGEVLKLELVATTANLDDKMISLINGIGCQSNGREYPLEACCAEITEPSSIAAVENAELQAYVIDRVLYVVAPAKGQVMLSAVNGASMMLDVEAGVNRYPMHAMGVYMVGNVKVIVK